MDLEKLEIELYNLDENALASLVRSVFFVIEDAKTDYVNTDEIAKAMRFIHPPLKDIYDEMKKNAG